MRRSGFEGVSVKRAFIGGEAGVALRSWCSRRASSASISDSEPSG